MSCAERDAAKIGELARLILRHRYESDNCLACQEVGQDFPGARSCPVGQAMLDEQQALSLKHAEGRW